MRLRVSLEETRLPTATTLRDGGRLEVPVAAEPRRCCTYCQQAAPEFASDFTLIGYSWRLFRDSDGQGKLSLRWVCPDCWTKKKRPAR